MTSFIAALAAFIVIHVGLSATGLRSLAVKATGEGVYRGLYSLASVALLAALIWTYGAVRHSPENLVVWTPPDMMRHIAHALMLASLLLVVPGLLTPGPTSLGFEGSISKPEPAVGVQRITRHPFLWGVSLWGLAHLLVNGDSASTALFGGLAVMCLLGTRSIDRKARERNPQDWRRYAEATSNVPFAAIAQGRNRLVWGEIWWKLIVALAAYAAIAYFHRAWFGMPAFAFL